MAVMDSTCYKQALDEVMAYVGVTYHRDALNDLWQRVRHMPNEVMAKLWSALIRTHNEGCRANLAAIEALIMSVARALELEKAKQREREWEATKAQERQEVLRMPAEVRERLQQLGLF